LNLELSFGFSLRSIWFVTPQHLACHSAAFGLSFRSIWFVIPQHLVCHSAAFGLSFRSIWFVIPQRSGGICFLFPRTSNLEPR
jgi:hypothetical protein